MSIWATPFDGFTQPRQLERKANPWNEPKPAARGKRKPVLGFLLSKHVRRMAEQLQASPSSAAGSSEFDDATSSKKLGSGDWGRSLWKPLETLEVSLLSLLDLCKLIGEDQSAKWHRFFGPRKLVVTNFHGIPPCQDMTLHVCISDSLATHTKTSKSSIHTRPEFWWDSKEPHSYWKICMQFAERNRLVSSHQPQIKIPRPKQHV